MIGLSHTELLFKVIVPSLSGLRAMDAYRMSHKKRKSGRTGYMGESRAYEGDTVNFWISRGKVVRNDRRSPHELKVRRMRTRSAILHFSDSGIKQPKITIEKVFVGAQG